jgi:hypothetical protein
MKVIFLILLSFGLIEAEAQNAGGFVLHKNITATVFWVGESGNTSSSWCGEWVKHFGGIDDPKNRNGFYPAGFTPTENPFYFALPFNELPSGCSAPDSILSLFTDSRTGGLAFFKNRWVKIVKDGVECYAQWEDVGPFVTCDPEYVFGLALPVNSRNDSAGIDVSPAVRDYLNLSGIGKVDWIFVNETDVPEGHWKNTVTRSHAMWRD